MHGADATTCRIVRTITNMLLRNRRVNDPAHHIGILLRKGCTMSTTFGMFMRSVTFLVQDRIQVTVHERNTPWLLDIRVLVCICARCQPIHASVEDRILEAVAQQYRTYVAPSPISAVTGQLDKNVCFDNIGRINDFGKSVPMFTEVTPMLLDLVLCGRAGEPDGIPRTTQ